MTLSAYSKLDRMMTDQCCSPISFGMLIADAPIALSEEIGEVYQGRYSRIRKLFRVGNLVLQEALSGELSPIVLRFLLGDSLPHVSEEHHRYVLGLEEAVPVFFRTDDPAPGIACEIQCPGSTWGEFAALEEYYIQEGSFTGSTIDKRFADDAKSVLSTDPAVHHMLDNSSMPGTMRYFIHRANRWIPHYGFTSGIRPADCNLIRSHSVYGLVAENHFQENLQAFAEGKLLFDLPPNLLFDSKVLLALPFWSHTRHYFTDREREILCFTSPVTPDGIELEDGRRLAVEEFSRLTRSHRNYYLKYAGADVSINWGSKAVFRLSNFGQDECRERLRGAVQDFTAGRPWIIQQEVMQKGDVTYLTREGRARSINQHVCYRGFHGPSGLLGLMALHREHYKVHGQEDAIASILVMP